MHRNSIQSVSGKTPNLSIDVCMMLYGQTWYNYVISVDLVNYELFRTKEINI